MLLPMLLEAPAPESDAFVPQERIIPGKNNSTSPAWLGLDEVFVDRRVGLKWSLGHHLTLDGEPEDWVDAVVPGAVQLDWARSKGWEPYWKGENFRQYRWMEDEFWTYETRLDVAGLKEEERLFFMCGGVDYRFVVSLNGRQVHAQEGMFTPVEIELTGHVSLGDVLRVTIYPAPKSNVVSKPTEEKSANQDEKKAWFAWDKLPEDNHTQANTSCKPAVSYGWDFHPRLIPLGIWKETYLEVRPAVSLRGLGLDYQLSEAFDVAEISWAAEIDGQLAEGELLRWVLVDPAGKIVFDERGAEACRKQILANPALWWPHDQGRPDLYLARVELLGKDGEVREARQSRMGFRRIRMVMAPGQWDWPMPFANINQRSRPPMTFEVNGRQIFTKGANWVSPEIFPGLLKEETYQTQVGLVRQSNMNMLRMWGGAPVQREEFYALCDELGIMVWQDFPLACNCYPDDAAYLKVLDQESRSIIAALKGHASVVCWCGGNELYNSWSRSRGAQCGSRRKVSVASG